MRKLRNGSIAAAAAFLASLALITGAPMAAQAASFTYYDAPLGAPNNTWSGYFVSSIQYSKASASTYQDLGATAYSRVEGVGTASAPMSVTQSFSLRFVRADCKWQSYVGTGKGILTCWVTQ
jgi:hypothetical protein